MAKNEATPCYVLFEMMKKYGGISNKDLASIILSGKPMFNGVSPASRAQDRTWLSRFIVNAPVEAIQENYFANFASSSLRIIARLASKKHGGLSSEHILEMVTGPQGEEMVAALQRCHQDVTLYQNILSRLDVDSGFTVSERAEIAVVLFVSAGCTASVRKAAHTAVEFSKAVHGAGMATPLITPISQPAESHMQIVGDGFAAATTLGLVRMVNGYLVGSPFWLNEGKAGTEIGALSLGEGAISDVENDVSGHHLRIWHEGDSWFAQGLGSKNGTVLISGLTHEEVAVELPEAQRESSAPAAEAVAIQPGDELVLGANTRFVVIEGIPV